MKKILLVEDDNNLGAILSEFLAFKGFEVSRHINGEDAWKAFNSDKYDICIIDIMMPRMDGFTLAKKIRTAGNVPFLFLTAKSMIEDKIEGFKLGADDYITKPFSMEELMMRINAILNRYNNAAINGSATLGKYVFNYDERILKTEDNIKKLTAKEADLLKILFDNKNKVVEKQFILKKIWGEDSYFAARSMDVYVSKLRNYLKDDNSIEISTLYGTGIKLIVK
ncbi:two component transcriptional regulator, winged helix family [Melioribacter roseus P3M-2]|uniref:Two component transcriptional regulator, winged helix family n=1 Tax=Melioribacter roseus (strain DSM 23840 / JCM 17771 / VKM B-2668 / P3M-2) TaxID=1191523 RepID=I7A3H1_MELRP|nr:response regulator transcription factor [Melioribacter roseus]AFN74426.1 two component transcriptional regulator, winged helix family [Melioribacter roseus P3M-2]